MDPIKLIPLSECADAAGARGDELIRSLRAFGLVTIGKPYHVCPANVAASRLRRALGVPCAPRDAPEFRDIFPDSAR